MEDFFKALVEAGVDKLFLFAGLAFIAIAVLGKISGRIDPGPHGRVAAAVIGTALFAAGFWLYSAHPVRISRVAVVPPAFGKLGGCPMSINVQGIIDAAGTGPVIYEFEFSDGATSGAQTVNVEQSESVIVDSTWRIAASQVNAWVRLHTFKPKEMISDPEILDVDCAARTIARHGEPSSEAAVGVIPRPPAALASEIRPLAPASSAATGGTMASPRSAPKEDFVRIVSTTPTPGSRLQRGQRVPIDVILDYTLVSADRAILSLSIAEIPASSAGCNGAGGELSDAAEVPIQQGTHRTQITVTWSGDTGAATRGRIYGAGSLGLLAMFWVDNNGTRGDRIKIFPKDQIYCYSFGA
jgi:hypothetical protein